MRAKTINEGEISDKLSPKPKEEIDAYFKKIEDKIKSFNIREDAIYYVTEILTNHYNRNIFTEVLSETKNEIIDYISDNEFNEALIYIIKDHIMPK